MILCYHVCLNSVLFVQLEIISRVHHRNLVKLIGYHVRADHQLLAFEYLPNGSLHDHLHGMCGATLVV